MGLRLRSGRRRPASPFHHHARSMEDVRQPAPVPHGAGKHAHPRDRVDAATAVRRALDGIRRRNARDSEPASLAGRSPAASHRHRTTEPCAGGRGRCPAGCGQDGADAGVAGAPGVVDVRCDRTDAVPAVRQPTQSARVGHGAGAEQQAPGRGRALPPDGRRTRHQPGGPRARGGGTGQRAVRGAVHAALAVVTPHGVLGEPAVARR